MNLVIIGSSAAGISCAEAVREKDKQAKITVISREDYRPVYSRCLLSYYLAGEIDEDKLRFRSADFYEKHDINIMSGVTAEKIDVKNRTVGLSGKRKKEFDRLLIATGSDSKFPKIPGIEKKGVYGLRTFEDARNILGRLKSTKRAAVLVGGLIGLKAVYGIFHHVRDIRVIVKSPQVLSRMIDRDAAAVFQAHIEEKGIKIMTGLEAVEVLGKDSVSGLKLDNGETLECELVIVGKGVSANIGLAGDAGIKTHWGILTDRYQMTGEKGIYAAGDCAETGDIVSGKTDTFGLWPLAVEQGRIAGLNIAGEKTGYDGSLSMNSVEFFGLPVISFGMTRLPREPEEAKKYSAIIREDRAGKVYKKIFIKDDRITGAILVGAIDSAGVLASLLRSKVDISPLRDSLLDDDFNFAKILPLVESNKSKFPGEEYREITL